MKYMVPWCAHSKKMKPIWDSLASKFATFESIKIARVDCQLQENLCNKQLVRGGFDQNFFV